MAEVSGLIAPLGAWVLRTACTQMATWHAEGHEDLNVSVNVSAHQFTLQDVPAVVREALAASGLPPESLELELTESVGLVPGGTVGAALLELQELGVRCSIDDFGTGYSSISYLHELSVDTVKLDQSFVSHIEAGEDAPMIRAMIAMAHNLGIRVVAEGVETKAQFAYLKKHRCDEVQGFLFSEPMGVQDVSAFLDRRAAMSPTSRRRVPVRTVVAASSSTIDPEALARLLWEESALRSNDQGVAVSGLGEEEEEGGRRRVAVLLVITAIMVVPVLLGLGAGGGLPPNIQAQVTDAFDVLGVRAPTPALASPEVSALRRPDRAPKDTKRGDRKRTSGSGPATSAEPVGRGTFVPPPAAAPSASATGGRASRPRSEPSRKKKRTDTEPARRTGTAGSSTSGAPVAPVAAPPPTRAPPADPAPAPSPVPSVVAPPAPPPAAAPTPAPVVTPVAPPVPPDVKPNSTSAPGQIKKTAEAAAAAVAPVAPAVTDPGPGPNGNGNGPKAP